MHEGDLFASTAESGGDETWVQSGGKVALDTHYREPHTWPVHLEALVCFGHLVSHCPTRHSLVLNRHPSPCTNVAGIGSNSRILIQFEKFMAYLERKYF